MIVLLQRQRVCDCVSRYLLKNRVSVKTVTAMNSLFLSQDSIKTKTCATGVEQRAVFFYVYDLGVGIYIIRVKDRVLTDSTVEFGMEPRDWL